MKSKDQKIVYYPIWHLSETGEHHFIEQVSWVAASREFYHTILPQERAYNYYFKHSSKKSHNT